PRLCAERERPRRTDRGLAAARRPSRASSQVHLRAVDGEAGLRHSGIDPGKGQRVSSQRARRRTDRPHHAHGCVFAKGVTTMAAAAWSFYNLTKRHLMDGAIDLDTNSFRMNLYTS